MFEKNYENRNPNYLVEIVGQTEYTEPLAMRTSQMCCRAYHCGHQEWIMDHMVQDGDEKAFDTLCLTALHQVLFWPQALKLFFVNFAWVLLEKPKLTVNMITLLMLMHALWTFCYTVYKYPYSTIIEILYY